MRSPKTVKTLTDLGRHAEILLAFPDAVHQQLRSRHSIVYVVAPGRRRLAFARAASFHGLRARDGWLLAFGCGFPSIGGAGCEPRTWVYGPA